ncbi:MAG TPA: hypothetical protein VK841_07495 [Polyangiaceae bacterium]|jgi:hypothetical protein|nr:hypothetical protein [Polyangiaceae bacterium]
MKARGAKKRAKTSSPAAPQSERRLKAGRPAAATGEASKPDVSDGNEWTDAKRDSEFLHSCADEIDTRAGDVRAAVLHVQSMIVGDDDFHGAFDDIRKALETLIERAAMIRERAMYRAA